MQINNNAQLNNDIYLNANRSLNRLASGQSINDSASNPAGQAIANQLLAQANSTGQAIENTNSAIALNQIADKAIDEQSNILDNVKEKLLQASTDTTSQDGREALLKDIQGQLKSLDSIAAATSYNEQSLLQKASDDTSVSESLQFQAGANGGDIIETSGVQANTDGLGLTSLLNADISTFSSADARSYLDAVDNAITKLNDFRAEFGSAQNQLESSSRNLLTQETQTLGAHAVYDTDYAKESANFSKQNILAQIGAFGQAQSNNINQQSVLRLLS